MIPRALTLGLICAALISFVARADNPAPTAGELFASVSAARTSSRADQILDPSIFSRETLEDALRSVDAAAKQPPVTGLNWERDALLAHLGALYTFDAVYSYALHETHVDPIGLRLQVSNCHRPYTLTIGFRFEAGLWRLHSFDFDSTNAATAWYHDGMIPIQTWPHVQARDRSAYFNASHLGKALGLELPPKQDDCVPGVRP